MPDIRQEEEKITAGVSKEALEHLDALASLAGQPSFTSQINALANKIAAAKGTIQKETSLTDKEVNDLMTVIPSMMTDTIMETFSMMSKSMQDVLSDPNKIKEAVQRNKS